MVLLFQTPETSSKSKDHHDSSESLSAFWHSFESEVSNHLCELSLHPKPGSVEMNSFSWIQRCLRLLRSIGKSFAKFVVHINFPVSEWKGFIVEEFLQDNLNLLDSLNCISSSINQMSQACMELLFALSLVKTSSKNLKPILPLCPNKKLKEEDQQEEEKVCSEKELMVHQSLILRKRTKSWICRIIDSSIRGDAPPSCLEIKTESNKLYSSSLVRLLSGIHQELNRKGIVKEVGEINKQIYVLLAAAREGRDGDEANNLQKMVEVLRKILDGVKEDVNRLFSETFVGRNEFVNSVRY